MASTPRWNCTRVRFFKWKLRVEICTSKERLFTPWVLVDFVFKTENNLFGCNWRTNAVFPLSASNHNERHYCNFVRANSGHALEHSANNRNSQWGMARHMQNQRWRRSEGSEVSTAKTLWTCMICWLFVKRIYFLDECVKLYRLCTVEGRFFDNWGGERTAHAQFGCRKPLGLLRACEVDTFSRYFFWVTLRTHARTGTKKHTMARTLTHLSKNTRKHGDDMWIPCSQQQQSRWTASCCAVSRGATLSILCGAFVSRCGGINVWHWYRVVDWMGFSCQMWLTCVVRLSHVVAEWMCGMRFMWLIERDAINRQVWLT